MKLSIIIPVYNTERYIKKCLLSCINQKNVSLSDYEIIVINDGTLDQAMSIAHKLLANCEINHKIINQKNEGQAVARNHGMQYANGDYIWFVDSDDWIREDALNIIFKKIEEHEFDMLTIGIEYFYDNGDNHFYIPNNDQGLLTVCSHIYNRIFLQKNDLFFVPYIYHEDFEIAVRINYFAKKRAVTKEPVYIVYKRKGSTTTFANPKKAFDLLLVARSLSEFCIKNKIDDNFYFYQIALALNNSLQNTHKFLINKENKEKLNELFYENRDLLIYLLKSNSLKYKLEFFLFKLFPHHNVEIFKFIQKFNTKDFSKMLKVND